MTIVLGATLLIFVVGLIGVVIAAVRGEYQGSTPWFLTAFWITCLASLGGIAIR